MPATKRKAGQLCLNNPRKNRSRPHGKINDSTNNVQTHEREAWQKQALDAEPEDAFIILKTRCHKVTFASFGTTQHHFSSTSPSLLHPSHLASTIAKIHSLLIGNENSILPLGLSTGFEKDVVSALDVHDAVFEVKPPLVPHAADLLVLTDDDVLRVEELFGVVVRHIIA